MQFAFREKAITLALLSSTTFAANLTVTKLPSDCSSYPAYDETTGIAGPWLPRSEGIEDSALNSLQLGVAPFTNDGIDRFGFITLPRDPPRLGSQNITFRCANSSLQALLPPAQFYPDDPRVWVDVVVSTEENWQASFGFNLTPSVPVQPFVHFMDGERVPGVFLGAEGKTRIAFKSNWGGNAGHYYIVRLLGGLVADGHGEGEKVKKERRQETPGFPDVDDRDWEGYLRIG